MYIHIYQGDHLCHLCLLHLYHEQCHGWECLHDVQKGTMTIIVYKNMIYIIKIKDKHVVMLRGTQMVN